MAAVAKTDATTGALNANGIATADVLALFQQLLPATFVTAALLKAEIREHNRIYSSLVVMWLMIWQRLQERGTLETAVLELVRSLPASFWPQPCKRLREAQAEGRKVSSHTGAYNQARQDLSQMVVEHCYDHAFEGLLASTMPESTTPPRAFFVDGTSVRTPHSEELAQTYPPSANQHGVSHWPMIRMLVMHDLYTGLGMRPEWGPMNGEAPVSEQSLLEKAIQRLPDGAMVVGDANFGVFSVAYALTQQGHPVILRLTKERAVSLGKGQLRDGMDQQVVWKPSAYERKHHPLLAADAQVKGRLIVCQVTPNNGDEPFLLPLFTTPTGAREQIVQTYGYRWRIEVDLRSLKSTLRLEDLTCTTPTMVAKEIQLGMFAYNLVRTVMYLTAGKMGLEPRAFSFTKVRNVLNAFIPAIAAAESEEEAEKLTAKMLYYLQQTKLPKRKKRPSYPRAVWYAPKIFPARKG
jgi:putative transposase